MGEKLVRVIQNKDMSHSSGRITRSECLKRREMSYSNKNKVKKAPEIRRKQ